MRIKQLLSVVSAVLLFATPAVRAQQARSVFVTPIAQAPFMAVVTEQRSSIEPNGTVRQLRSFHAIARNSAGVIYNEGRSLVPASFAGDPPVNVSHIYDPQTRLNTFLYPQQKAYQQRRLLHPPSTQPPGLYGVPEASTLPDSQFTQEKDLGSKTMEGLTVHGVLITQKMPSEAPGGQDVTVTDEYWYSADLRLNMLIKRNDPRSGSATITVTQVTRSEPDEAIFQIPSGYKPLEMGEQDLR